MRLINHSFNNKTFGVHRVLQWPLLGRIVSKPDPNVWKRHYSGPAPFFVAFLESGLYIWMFEILLGPIC